MGYLLNGVEDGGCPFYLVKKIIEGIDVPYFVETGTAGAYSVTKAAEIFKECHTIEIIEGRTPKEKETIVVHEEDPTIVDYIPVAIEYPENIKFHIGDSPKVLGELVEKVKNDYAVFWLDAHYSDDVPSEDGVVECPIIEELEAIKDCQKAIILIDDARLFLGTPPLPLKPALWASVKDIFITVLKHFPNHHFTIVDDYIVIVPNELKSNLSIEWLERYNIRYK
jgi:hypothetical protein